VATRSPSPRRPSVPELATSPATAVPRIPGEIPGSSGRSELAPGKARTAALFKKPSQALEDAISNGRIAAVTARDIIEMHGGLPIIIDGQVIGGIGASFDTRDHDVQIAQAGLAALTRLSGS
jgi:uncharacterized protein GlcG (DUF336 family)